MNASAYPVIVRPLPPEQGVGYVAEVPDLPGCTAAGPTPADACTRAPDAIPAWLEKPRRTRAPGPPPPARPDGA
ncbi:type II toxin-antitoxin system HicB family antitoxin, partial [Azospirillum brasilense]|nr:type II toxin-antitoxin system HicB family antitoxin [Azospirillum brasilense]